MTTRTANRTPKPWTPTASERTRMGNLEVAQAANRARLDALERRLAAHDAEIDRLGSEIATAKALAAEIKRKAGRS